MFNTYENAVYLLKILIIEDNADLVEQYRIILKEKNHEITSALDGQQGWNIFSKAFEESKKSAFDLVIIDYDMPKMNGVEVSKKILECSPDQRIIFATGFIQETLEKSAKELKHVVELLHKPFRLETLVKVVENFDVYEKLQKMNSKMDEVDEFDPDFNELDGIYSEMKSNI